MMLRSRSGVVRFKVVDKATNERLFFELNDFYNQKQISRLNSPDMFWQAAQYIKKHYAEQGVDVAVYVSTSLVSINEKPALQLIDSNVDLANESWNHFKHHNWILLSYDSVNEPFEKSIN